MNGFLNLNKPPGFTSHDCVAKARKLLNLKRIGHAGTLDPAAIGVLPIAIGRATRLLQYLRSDKAYRATLRFGVTTSTDDLEGETLTCQAVPQLTLDAIREKLPLFLGKIQQIPPTYSAIQVEGKRLYDLARSGQTIAIPARAIEVYTLDILAWRPGDFPELELAIACGAGTYIRAIARDLGAILKTGATLAALTRTESSGFMLSDSLTFEALAQHLAAGTFAPIAPDHALTHLPKISLPDDLARRWCQGQKILSEPPETQPMQVWDEQERFLGITRFTEGVLVPQMVFEPL
ncbi:tRNA pseudouridine(55) synthase TruB [Myxacorys almedinensis]|uniref:tRNA pseudouridine synthase B n=1 Tax=Myxacorys almedinensis A TaxID=2690445 RepID=A0A8J7Z6Q8_9CYAN|nr:tRNA pseudouridine(55) synthase TruB [Myxacorys almedinensis A]